MSVVTTAGAAVTVIVAATVIGQPRNIPQAALAVAASAIVLFVAAMIGGLVVNRPRRAYEAAAADDLERIADSEDYWSGPLALGMRRSAQVQIKVLRAARASRPAGQR
jgi:hypothetical protein